MEKKWTQSVETHVRRQFDNEWWQKYPYHCLKHTEEVVSTCLEIAEALNISDSDLEALIIAAWFHDLGFLHSYVGHEKQSQELAKTYLIAENYDVNQIDKILHLIDSTRMDYGEKRTLLEEIMHDADRVNMGKKSFLKKGFALKKEWKRHGLLDSKKSWGATQKEYLDKTNFLTWYAREKYDAEKKKNAGKIKKMIASEKTKQSKTLGKQPVKYGRVIETMYRSIYRNEINLSAIADNKANMMIGINAILLSGIITVSGAGLIPDDSFIIKMSFVIPITILVVSSLVAMIYAILSARPNIPNLTQFSENGGLFFFENFAQLKREEFISKIKEIEAEDEIIYRHMSADIYDHGLILSKKYRKLKKAYNIFMYGLVIAVASHVLLLIVSSTI